MESEAWIVSSISCAPSANTFVFCVISVIASKITWTPCFSSRAASWIAFDSVFISESFTANPSKFWERLLCSLEISFDWLLDFSTSLTNAFNTSDVADKLDFVPSITDLEFCNIPSLSLRLERVRSANLYHIHPHALPQWKHLKIIDWFGRLFHVYR